MRTTWTFQTAAKILFGRDAVGQLGETAGELGARRALVVTDRTLAGAGLAEQVCAPLEEAGVATRVFDGGEPEAPAHAAESAVALAREWEADLLVGLGGVSYMDLA